MTSKSSSDLVAQKMHNFSPPQRSPFCLHRIICFVKYFLLLNSYWNLLKQLIFYCIFLSADRWLANTCGFSSHRLLFKYCLQTFARALIKLLRFSFQLANLHLRLLFSGCHCGQCSVKRENDDPLLRYLVIIFFLYETLYDACQMKGPTIRINFLFLLRYTVSTVCFRHFNAPFQDGGRGGCHIDSSARLRDVSHLWSIARPYP